MEDWERDELISNFVNLVGQCDRDIQERMVSHLSQCDEEYGRRRGRGPGHIGRREADGQDRRRAFPTTLIKEEEMAQKAYTEDVLRLAQENENFRQVLFTTERSQLVLMSLKPGEEIGEEVHEGIDQVLAFAGGVGEAVIEGNRSSVRAGTVVVVPGGTRHNFVNTGSAPLKLFTIYTPPEHPDGTTHRTKEEADEYEREHHH